MRNFALLFTLLFGLSLSAQPADSLDAKYQLALQEIGRFQFEKALRHLSTCYIQRPDHIPYLQQIGYCHFQLGRYSDATIFYSEALKKDSNNTTSLSYLGAIAEKQLDLNRAEQYFGQLIELDTSNAYYFKRHAQLAHRLRRPLLALESYLRAYRLNKSDAEVSEALADLYIQFDQQPYAEKVLKEAISIAPRNLKLHYVWARLKNVQKDYPEVISTLNYCMGLGDTSNYFQMMLGAAYILEDSMDAGIHHLEQVVRRKKASEAAFYYLGLAYQEKGEPNKAKTYLLNAIDKGTSERLGTYFDDLSVIFQEEGDQKQAIAYLRKAWEQDKQPKQLFRLARLSEDYYRDKTVAIRYFEQYLDTEDEQFRDYAGARLRVLREWQHMQSGN